MYYSRIGVSRVDMGQTRPAGLQRVCAKNKKPAFAGFERHGPENNRLRFSGIAYRLAARALMCLSLCADTGPLSPTSRAISSARDISVQTDAGDFAAVEAVTRDGALVTERNVAVVFMVFS